MKRICNLAGLPRAIVLCPSRTSVTQNSWQMKAGSWNKLLTLVEVNTRIYCAKPVAGDHHLLDRCGPNWAVQVCCGFITPETLTLCYHERLSYRVDTRWSDNQSRRSKHRLVAIPREQESARSAKGYSTAREASRDKPYSNLLYLDTAHLSLA